MTRAAVVGAGSIAREHLDCLAGLPDVEIAGVCDTSAALAEAAAERYRVARWFVDHRELLAELKPDIVHVTTPPRSHYTLARDALEAGAHVVVEKPLALHPDEAPKLLEIAARRQLLLIEDHNYLFNRAVRKIRRMIDAGALGEVVHVEVLLCVDVLGPGARHSDPQAPDPLVSLPGGPIADFLTHLAYLAWAFAGTPRSVHTSWRKRGTSAAPADEFRALIDGERASATLTFSAHAQPDLFSLRVHGTRMRVATQLFEPLFALEKVHRGPRPLTPVRNGLAAAAAHLRGALESPWKKLRGQPTTYEGLWELLRLTYQSVRTGAPPPVSPEQIESVNRLFWQLVGDEHAP